MNNIQNQVAFLRTSRTFPQNDAHQLSVEIDRAYLDIANTVNSRIIGLFPTNFPAITGESWFPTSVKQQTLRQVYRVTGSGNIAHGINLSNITGFTRIYGTFTDGSVWYPLPFVDVTAANNQVQITITSTNIVITAGGGAPPTISSGYVVLEWLSNA